MFKKWILSAVVLGFVFSTPAFAGVGDACTVANKVYTSEGPTTDVLICDAGTLTLKTARSLKTNPVREGIATASPEAALDVAGEIKIGNTSLACSATTEGAIRYDSAGNIHEFCDGSSWGSLGGGSGTPVGANREIQFNSGGVFGADSNFSYTSAGRLITGGPGTNNVFITGGNETTTAINTVAIGTSAGAALTGGANNVFIGQLSGAATTIGVENVAIGRVSLRWNAGGGKNVALGYDALGSTTTAAENVAMGRSAGRGDAFGASPDFSVFIGHNAGLMIDTGQRNTFLGYKAGDITTTGSDNILIGSNTDAPTATTSNHLNIGDTIYGDLSTDMIGIGVVTPISTLHVPDGKYLQAEDNNAGAPPSADCDADNERGRQSIDTTNNRLYICNGASRGWDYIALTD